MAVTNAINGYYYCDYSYWVLLLFIIGGVVAGTVTGLWWVRLLLPLLLRLLYQLRVLAMVLLLL